MCTDSSVALLGASLMVGVAKPLLRHRILLSKQGIQMQRHTTGNRFNLGLRWLAAPDENALRARGRDWNGFLSAAADLPEPHRLWIARLWPLLALVNGPLALSGLMLWPERSGVHLLLFLLVFVVMPLVLVLWSGINGLLLGRSPWWGHVLLRHHDRVIALWCARQSLLLHGLFCIAGLGWLWLSLATRQVIFYWGTSIVTVSERVAVMFDALSPGWMTAPGLAAVRAAEAGAITGWQDVLLADTLAWAIWLTQIVTLWLLIPCAVLLLLCHWRLRKGIANWPNHNLSLRRRFDQATEPVIGFRSLQPEQPVVEPIGHLFPVVVEHPEQPGFCWRVSRPLPVGSIPLGERDHAADESRIRRHGELKHWYIASHVVPTGDLADLLQLHCDTGNMPRLNILLEPSDLGTERLDALRHSWGVFLERNHLRMPVQLLDGNVTLDQAGGADDQST